MINISRPSSVTIAAIKSRLETALWNIENDFPIGKLSEAEKIIREVIADLSKERIIRNSNPKGTPRDEHRQRN